MRENEQRLVDVLADRIFRMAGSARKAAPLIDMGHPTLYRRLADPEKFTIAELRTIAKELKVPEEKLMPALQEAIYGSELKEHRSE